jgi:hypothetical protein
LYSPSNSFILTSSTSLTAPIPPFLGQSSTGDKSLSYEKSVSYQSPHPVGIAAMSADEDDTYDRVPILRALQSQRQQQQQSNDHGDRMEEDNEDDEEEIVETVEETETGVDFFASRAAKYTGPQSRSKNYIFSDSILDAEHTTGKFSPKPPPSKNFL